MYKCLMAKSALEKVDNYLSKLQAGAECGRLLEDQLRFDDLDNLSREKFLEILVNTKRPQIFAESAICGNGLDWNHEELSILGDMGVAVPVTIFDNGQHRMPEVHTETFLGTLLYIPGALLQSTSNTPADWEEVVKGESINLEAYISLYERRLLPLLLYANDQAHKNQTKAFITIPGLGCGQFAGPFRGVLGEYLKKALYRILEGNIKNLPNITTVYYDPYEECMNDRFELGHISLLVRPLTKGNLGKSQLSQLSVFNELDDDFNNSELFSIVAWDHVSWPGNDFYSGARVTDDGVKAAATDSMKVITGISGTYYSNHFKYVPPENYSCWRDVVYQNDLTLKVENNLTVY